MTHDNWRLESTTRHIADRAGLAPVAVGWGVGVGNGMEVVLMTRYGSLSRPEQDHFSESSGFQKLCARMIDQAIKDMEGKIDLDAMEWWVHGDYGILPLRTCAAELGVTERQIKNMAPEHTDWEPLKPLLDGLRVMRGLLALVKNASQDPESFEYYAAFKIMRDTMDSLRIDGFSDIYESGEW